MPKETKNCPNCLNTFIAKRLNQKYCFDSCRIEKSNARSRDLRELTKTANKTLLKNRNILATFEGERLSEIDLKIKGFKFGYVTNFRTNASNETEFICYDYGYFVIEKKGVRSVESFALQKE
jgi:hypothetical protein